MRILNLRFQNLNSLVGEWEIDFTHPDYTSFGIFAITGATGAGKTTILDAICLALYGKTPRLTTISKKTNEIMTRHSGECFSEVEFLSQKGRYRCHWSQKRAYSRPNGDLQPSRHDITDVSTGMVLETKLSAVLTKVIDLTGMDYQQFTRSILLAQGDFATFLDANADDRGLLLEKITGIGIYGKISMKVHERMSIEQTTLDNLQAMIGSIDLLSPEQELELHQEKIKNDAEIKNLSTKRVTLQEAVAWVTGIVALNDEILLLTERRRMFEEKKAHATEEFSQLSNARRAHLLDGDYFTLAVTREHQRKETEEQAKCEDHLAELTDEFQKSILAEEHAKELFQSVQDEKKKEDRLIVEVREQDLRIAEIAKNICEKMEELDKLKQKMNTFQQTLKKLELKIRKIRPALLDTCAYLDTHPADRLLQETLSGIEQKIQRFCKVDQEVTRKREELQKNAIALKDTETEVASRKSALDAEKQNQARTAKDLASLRAEYEKILDDQDLLFWRSRESTQKDRRDQLRSFEEILTSRATTTAEIQALAKTYESQIQNQTENAERLVSLQKVHELMDAVVSQLEENLILRSRVQSFEKERHCLLDGKPCPLCGSVDHPYAQGNVPAPDEVCAELKIKKKEKTAISENIRQFEIDIARVDAELHSNEDARSERRLRIVEYDKRLADGFSSLKLDASDPCKNETLASALITCGEALRHCQEIVVKAEESERLIRGAESTISQGKDTLADLTTLHQKAEADHDRCKTAGQRIQDEIVVLDQECFELGATLVSDLEGYGVTSFIVEDAEDTLASLKKRWQDYEAQLTKKLTQETELAQFTNDADHAESLLEASGGDLDELHIRITELEMSRADLIGRRRDLYGDKDPVTEEERYTHLLESREHELATVTGEMNRLLTQKTSLEDRVAWLKTAVGERALKLKDEEARFIAGLQRTGFAVETEFVAARLSQERFEELDAQEKELNREDVESAASLLEKTTKRDVELGRQLTGETLDDLELAIAECDTKIAGLNKDLGMIRHRLEQHAELMTQKQVLINKREAQRREFSRWERLHDLIGSADGKKFRIFAQGLTFETLIAHANRHLHKMSDRYLLLRSTESPLDLTIMDNYHAGEIRSTKNLSGGESFLVSLALALGLSGMASKNVRIDSLFLDEGFGTLDEETLETALETLSGLQREGKIIGVISHVPALRERIPVQILVEKLSGGRSRLIGPGCSQNGR